MENPSLPENGKKKRWTVEEKAQIVRRYLKDHGSLADLAEETGSIPRADSGVGQTGSGRNRANILPGDAAAEKGSASGDPGKGRPDPEAGIGCFGALHREPTVKKSRGDPSPGPMLRQRRRKRS